jgi:hypothetical protein
MTAPKMQLPYYSFVKRGGNLCNINPLKEFQKTRSRGMTAEYREDNWVIIAMKNNFTH